MSLVTGWSSIVVLQIFCDSIYTSPRAKMLVAILKNDLPMHIVRPEVLSKAVKVLKGYGWGSLVQINSSLF